MSKLIYSDYVFLSELAEELNTAEESRQTREAMIDMLNLRIRKINRANGVWALPDKRKRCVNLLNTIIDLLVVELSFKAIRGLILSELGDKAPRCKVLFLTQEMSVWPSLESVYTAMLNDDRFEPQVVYLPFQHKNKQDTGTDEREEYIDAGVDVYDHSEYDLRKEAPDVAFYVKPYDGNIPNKFNSTEVGRIVDRLIYVAYGMELSNTLLRYGYHEYMHYASWKHIVYGDIVREKAIQHGFRNGENIAVWGHPKADIYAEDKEYAAPAEWLDKINGRKVLLWCPHHTVIPNKEKVSTWVEFSETVFDAVQKHPEIVLLMRPHPMLFGALKNNGFVKADEFDAMIESKKTAHNIILDETDDYRIAAQLSDGLITDGTTFAIEYLYANKPYMITTLDPDCFYESDKMKDALYIGQKKREIEEFIDMFAAGKDPKKGKRDAYRRETFFLPEEGTVGEYIAEQILLEISAEEKERTKTNAHHK